MIPQTAAQKRIARITDKFGVMAYHPRIELNNVSWLLTTRTQGSRLWFINNKPLQESMLSYAAKYTERYQATLYALAIEGNHVHTVMDFPNLNRSDFMRDLNSCIARAVARHVPEYENTGRLWGRRYSSEILPDPQDVEARFFYTVLQPVHDGLAQRISDYPGYNCFHDAVFGITREFKVVNWGAYNKAKGRNRRVSVSDYVETVTLCYKRLPGYEELSQKEYERMMLQKLEKNRVQAIKDRLAKGLGYISPEDLRKLKPGSLPRHTKTSTRESYRPRVLAICPIRRAEWKTFYFEQIALYRIASEKYRAGDHSAKFPPGMYPPYYRPPAAA